MRATNMYNNNPVFHGLNKNDQVEGIMIAVT